MECCFFDGWADRFNILAENKDIVGHVVLILQLARVKYFNDKPSITNVVFATKIYNNVELPEIETFKKRYQEVEGYDDKRHIITLFSPTRKEITPEIFFIGAVKKMVCSIRDCFEKQEILVYAKIHKIHREFGKAASKFKKNHKTFSCKFHKGVIVVPKYKVIVRVTNESGSACLLMYEDMIMKFIDVPCYNMIEKYKDCTNGSFPDELKVVVEKTMLFQIDYSDWNIKHNNHVKMMTEDPAMIETLKKDFYVEVNNVEFQTPVTNGGSNSKLCYADVIPFNIEQTPESDKAMQSADGGSSSKDKSDGESGSNGKQKREVIDLDNYVEDESAAKKGKNAIVEVKVEKPDA
ncbi:hypothetical protein Tco_1321616 [Tanacetum coccineum]